MARRVQPTLGMTTKIHPFEMTGLGVAPFVFIGTTVKLHHVPGEMPRAGSSCDFCGTGIALECWIRGADGRTFKVGCDCVRKTNDPALVKRATEAQKEHERNMRAARNAKRESANMLRIWKAWAQWDAVREAFGTRPHPRGFVDRETGRALTLADWAKWMMVHAGTSGRLQVAKEIEKELQ
jgi:hypothetical protein